MRCLLVDDEPGIREGLATLLRRKGHVVRTAADCAAAQRALRDETFDVVVSDWRLPDGLASAFLAGCPQPVIAISGHPEEVAGIPSIHQVLTKPVAPAVLAAAITAAGTAAAVAPVTELPADVQEVVSAFVGGLPAGSQADLCDDGTFVTVRAELPADAMPPPAAGGDLRVGPRGARLLCELRLCRDGRPDTAVPVVPAGAPWPAGREFAVDFHDTRSTPEQFLRCLDAARDATRAGRRVHFLNVPPVLRACAASHGRTHDMPMRETVGPRLAAVLADLWSHSNWSHS